ncbi:MAG: hypothetical protein Q8N13_11155 [Acidovorax sp.]|nr:hypothetical protein [Acidovorax sp.]
MHKLTPTRPNVKDAATGEDMPAEGVIREVLLPPDHYAERSGDITIEEIKSEPAAPAGVPPVAEKASKAAR